MGQGGEEDSGEEDEDNEEESDGGDDKEEDNLEFEGLSFSANEMEADTDPSGQSMEVIEKENSGKIEVIKVGDARKDEVKEDKMPVVGHSDAYQQLLRKFITSRTRIVGPFNL
ncbi:hypothetical protein TorRG33x02_127120 [Trema orientale]|uniref:Uncharacterized protein n=1 Tax=Trema orientale TaxID=63057 RepID=A0A2P5F0Y2_TREOI|nr:hypothetical protein TorRG33x02_127120 [Trema orientale]